MLLHSAATALLQRTAYKTICWFSASPIGKMFPQPLHRTSSFPLLNICSDVSSHFHIFSFPQNAFITAFPLCGHLSFFPENQRFQILTSALCFTAFCGLFLFSEDTRRYLLPRIIGMFKSRKLQTVFQKLHGTLSSPDNPETVRLLFSRHSSPVFRAFPPPAPFRWPGTSVPRRRRNCRDIRLPPEHRRYRPLRHFFQMQNLVFTIC